MYQVQSVVVIELAPCEIHQRSPVQCGVDTIKGEIIKPIVYGNTIYRI